MILVRVRMLASCLGAAEESLVKETARLVVLSGGKLNQTHWRLGGCHQRGSLESLAASMESSVGVELEAKRVKVVAGEVAAACLSEE